MSGSHFYMSALLAVDSAAIYGYNDVNTKLK